MKKIYINESQLSILKIDTDNKKEVTFYEFFMKIKSFLKDLLKKPVECEVDSLFKDNNISKEDLIKKMLELNLLTKDERIDEISIDESKKVAKHYIKYNIIKNNFDKNIKSLFKEFFKESYDNWIVKNKNAMIVNETDCGGVMQGGGTNPDAGQISSLPIGPVNRKKSYAFFGDTLKRNKDEKNNSISMNRK